MIHLKMKYLLSFTHPHVSNLYVFYSSSEENILKNGNQKVLVAIDFKTFKSHFFKIYINIPQNKEQTQRGLGQHDGE